MIGFYSKLSDIALAREIKYLKSLDDNPKIKLRRGEKVKLKLLYKEQSKRLSKATMTIRNLIN